LETYAICVCATPDSRELEDDVVGEAVYQAAQLGGRAAILALGDQAARREVDSGR